MTEYEIIMLKVFLEKCQHYFEFGCGGTTILASSYQNIKTIISVDGNKDWIDSIVLDTKTTFIHVDVNGGGWGYPKDESLRYNWPLYSSSVKRYSEIDLILVDGRFRVCCALNSFYSLSDNGYLLIHDYTIRRHYHCIEIFYEKILSIDTLTAFVKKKKHDQCLLQNMILQYQYIPD